MSYVNYRVGGVYKQQKKSFVVLTYFHVALHNTQWHGMARI